MRVARVLSPGFNRVDLCSGANLAGGFDCPVSLRDWVKTSRGAIQPATVGLPFSLSLPCRRVAGFLSGLLCGALNVPPLSVAPMCAAEVGSLDRSRRAVILWGTWLPRCWPFLLVAPSVCGRLGVQPVVARVVPSILRSRAVRRVLPVLDQTVVFNQNINSSPLHIDRSVSLGGGPQNFSLEVSVAGALSSPVVVSAPTTSAMVSAVPVSPPSVVSAARFCPVDPEVPPPPTFCEVNVAPSALRCPECVPGLFVCPAHLVACG